jgi:hypothetical protein
LRCSGRGYAAARTLARTHTRDKRAHADSLSSHAQQLRCDYGSSRTRHAARGGVVEPTGRWCGAGHGRVRVRSGPRQCGGVQVFRIMRSEPAQPLCVEADDGAGGRKPLRTRTQARARTALCTALLRAHARRPRTARAHAPPRTASPRAQSAMRMRRRVAAEQRRPRRGGPMDVVATAVGCAAVPRARHTADVDALLRGCRDGGCE